LALVLDCIHSTSGNPVNCVWYWSININSLGFSVALLETSSKAYLVFRMRSCIFQETCICTSWSKFEFTLWHGSIGQESFVFSFSPVTHVVVAQLESVSFICVVLDDDVVVAGKLLKSELVLFNGSV